MVMYKIDWRGGVKKSFNRTDPILVRSVIKFLDRNMLFVERVQVLLELILSRALAKD